MAFTVHSLSTNSKVYIYMYIYTCIYKFKCQKDIHVYIIHVHFRPNRDQLQKMQLQGLRLGIEPTIDTLALDYSLYCIICIYIYNYIYTCIIPVHILILYIYIILYCIIYNSFRFIDIKLYFFITFLIRVRLQSPSK